MPNITQLVEELLSIEQQLEALAGRYADFYETYDGNHFAEQSQLATNALDNLILASTHEIASEIGFRRQSITLLCQLITFRKKYHYLTDESLILIIDTPNLTAQQKLALQKTRPEKLPLNTIKTEWNQLFNNKSYQKIKQALHITNSLR